MNTFNDVQYGRSQTQPIYSREDANRVKKEMEQERRLMRLQQVREESKNLARKIRTDVANEKDRQLRQLEFAKAQELENWRQQVMTQQHQDYRTAIFQVGSAHQAAQLEKQRMALRECNRAKAQGDFRQQLRARLSCNVPEKELNQQPLFLNAMECPPGVSQQQYMPDDFAKPKRNVCFNQVCSPGGGNRENADESSDLYSSCCDSSVTDSSMSPVSQRRAALTKTPAIILDVDSDNPQDVSGRPREIKDNHVKSNRQFTKVVSDKSPAAPKAQASKKLFPKKAPAATKKPLPSKKPPASKKPQESTKTGSPTKPAKTTTLPTKRTSTVTAAATARKAATPKKKATAAPSASPQKTATTKSKTGATPEKVNLNAASPSKRPARFTEVSDLLRQRNAEKPPPPPNTSPRTSRTPSPERGRGKSPPPSFGGKSLKTTSLKSSVTIDKGASLDTSAATSNMPPLTVTTRMTQMTASSASKSSSGTLLSSGRVQFFDYRNKFSKEYTQPESAVRLEAHEHTQPNAMEQASIETGLRQTQAREFDNLRKKSDERGLMALEREQARRDCIDLTEKLEALSKQHPPSQFMAPDPPLLPSHHFVDQAALRERKMNAAMEDIVLKPAIITCPVIDGDYYAGQQGQQQPQQQQQIPQLRSGAATVLNLGSNTADFNQSNSSASAHSILLGYVNDQSQQLRNDLLECNSSDNQQEKTRKLKELLVRIEALRDSLIVELERQSATSVAAKGVASTSANVQNLMDTITDVRRQRDSLVEAERPTTTAEQLAELRRHEKECRDNRTRFDEQMRKLCDLLQNASDEKVAASTGAKLPKRYAMEVDDKDDGQEKAAGGMVRKHVKSRPTKRHSSSSQAKQVKSPRRLSTLAKLPAEVAAGSKKNRHRQRSSLLKQQRQGAEPQPPAVVHSFDSNSTSYRSLPPVMTNRLDDVYQRAPQTPETSFNETEQDSLPPAPRDRRPPPASINPLLAQYVNRLLAMSHRSSINALGVSSSEVDTPNSSVVNTSSNRRPGKGLPQREDAWAEERMHRVRRFIQENHNFIQELESTLMSNQSNAKERVTLETSMQAIEAIWQQRFGDKDNNKENKKLPPPSQQQKLQAAQPKKSGDEEAKKRSSKKAPGTPGTKEGRKKSSEAKRKATSETEPRPIEKAAPIAPPPSRTKLPEKPQEPAQTKRAPQEAAKSRSVQTQVAPTEVSAAEAEAQMARYDQMTRNCAERIEQLSGMINKVREEKLKLLESTYTSVSSNERNSTEYAELPKGGHSDTSSTSTATVSSRGKAVPQPPEPVPPSKATPSQAPRSQATPSQAPRSQATPSKALPSQAPSSQQPPPQQPPPQARPEPQPQQQQQSTPSSSTHALDKQKATGWSRDSGIYGSRPVTALGDYQAQSEGEPVSTSSHSAGPLTSASQIVLQQANKARPPATLRRFSPQLVEEEAHELSTILEVDTPVTSRINASVQATAEASSSSTKLGQPVAFPTFEEYAQQTNLNLTQLDPNVSTMIEQEYNQLIAQLRDSSLLQHFSYEEFPSLTTYMRNTNETSQPGLAADLNESPENVEELLNCLRLANVTLRSFPSHKDYVKEKRSGDAAQNDELIDSSSLENVTTSSSSAQSNTLDIDEELQRRNIVTKTVRNDRRVVTSTLSRSVDYGDTKVYAKVVTAESGVEKLSTSDNLSSDLERELHGFGLAWTATMRKKGKQAAALGSTSSSTTPTASSMDPLPPGGDDPRQQKKGDRTQMELPLDCALEDDSPHSTLIDEGQPLNLRDFLTRELMKRVNSSESNTSYTDDSLRSQFLNSIIDSLSPRTTTAVPSNTATSAQNRTDRQKTSTPVPSNSAQSRSRGGGCGGGMGAPSGIPLLSSSTSTDINSSSNLFSGESRLSSVHYQDYPVVRFFSSTAKEEKAAAKKPKDK